MNQPIKGLGLILRPTVDPAIAIVVGVPFSGLGLLGTYHCFATMSKVGSLWGKTGLAIGGVLSVGMVVEGAYLAVKGFLEAIAPTLPPVKPLPENMAGRRRIRGIGEIRQPELMVGQDHWLDRDWPDRYSEWWVGPAPRL